MKIIKSNVGLIGLVVNVIVVTGGLIFTNGKQTERINILERDIIECKLKIEKIDDISRRIEVTAVKLETLYKLEDKKGSSEK